jgi:hypothetical protein
MPVEENFHPGEMIASQDAGFEDINFTRVDDLGQFWLWNSADFDY